MRGSPIPIFTMSILALSWALGNHGAIGSNPHAIRKQACEMDQEKNADCEREHMDVSPKQRQQEQQQRQVPPNGPDLAGKDEKKRGSDADVTAGAGSGGGGGTSADPPPRTAQQEWQQRREADLREREMVMLHLERIERAEMLKNAAKIRRISEEQEAVEQSLLARAASSLAQRVPRHRQHAPEEEDEEAAQPPDMDAVQGDGHTRGASEDTGALSEEQQLAMQAEAEAAVSAYLEGL